MLPILAAPALKALGDSLGGSSGPVQTGDNHGPTVYFKSAPPPAAPAGEWSLQKVGVIGLIIVAVTGMVVVGVKAATKNGGKS